MWMVAVDEAAPDFTLMDQNGQAVPLSSFLEKERDAVVGLTVLLCTRKALPAPRDRCPAWEA